VSVLGRRVRGFRLFDLVAFLVLVALILGVYLAKTIAGRERAEIASAERQIEAEKGQIRVLNAEVAHLEEPARIQKLSETYLGMAPVPIKREVDADALAEVALHPVTVSKAPAPGEAAPR
jgi:cell division protein FtsL